MKLRLSSKLTASFPMGSHFCGVAFRPKLQEFHRTLCSWWFTKFVVCLDRMTYRKGKLSQFWRIFVEGLGTRFFALLTLRFEHMWLDLSYENRKPTHLCEKWRPTQINTTHWQSAIFAQTIVVVV